MNLSAYNVKPTFWQMRVIAIADIIDGVCLLFTSRCPSWGLATRCNQVITGSVFNRK